MLLICVTRCDVNVTVEWDEHLSKDKNALSFYQPVSIVLTPADTAAVRR